MLTKRTTSIIKAQYEQAMAIFASEHVHEVFSSEVTMVIHRNPDTTNHDIWFYRFKDSPDRLAMITDNGQTMRLDSGSLEGMVHNAMLGLPHAIQDKVDWVREAKAERAAGRDVRRYGFLGRDTKRV